jgi:hypothetical protein
LQKKFGGKKKQNLCRVPQVGTWQKMSLPRARLGVVDEDVDEDDDGPITSAVIFSFSLSLSSPKDSHDDSMSVSQSPTI